MRLHSIAALVSLGLTTSLAAQRVETMPNPLPTSVRGNAFPFANTSIANAQHVQFIYDGSQISSTAPVLIQRLRFRSTGSTTGGSMTNVTIKLSQCPVAWNAITTTYANNMTAAKTVTVVNNGTVNFTPTAGAGWAYDLKLTTPYLYDPSKGPLVFDWERSANSVRTGGFTAAMAGDATSPLKGSRTYGPAGQPTAAGFTTGSTGYACAAEITWVPASGLYSSFTATPVAGKSPLTVKFTDTTYSSAPPVKTWAWDFNGDNVVDSTVQNPTYTFTGTGFDQYFDVTLTTTDGTNPTSKVTQKNFIRVNPSVASTVDFGAGSTNKPAPTPIRVPPNTSHFNSATAIRGYYFVAPTTFLVTGFEAANTWTTPESDQTVVCYVLNTPPTGSFTATAADVKFIATGKANQVLRPTAPIVVRAGQWFGVFGACHGATAGSLFRNSYGTGGYSSSVLGRPITLNRLWMNADPRTNNGLGLVSQATGSLARVFVQVAGNVAVPTLTCDAAPILGTTPNFDMQAVFSGAQVGLLLMSARQLPAPVPTPYGNLLITPPFLYTVAVPNGTGQVPFLLPNNNAYRGIELAWQGAIFDFSTTTYGLTNGTQWTIGLRN